MSKTKRAWVVGVCGVWSIFSLACSAGRESPFEHPVAHAQPTTSIGSGASSFDEVQLLGVDLEQHRVALRVKSRWIDTLGNGDASVVCKYPGESRENQGVDLFLANLRESSVQRWTIYESLRTADTVCTEQSTAKRELGAAKSAMRAAGLAVGEPLVMVSPTPTDGDQQTVEVGGHTLTIAYQHESEMGFHTYTATANEGDRTLLRVSHSPNASSGGSGDLRLAGVYGQGDKVVLFFSAPYGPAAALDQWMISPVIDLVAK